MGVKRTGCTHFHPTVMYHYFTDWLARLPWSVVWETDRWTLKWAERVWMPLLLTAVICWILLKETTEMGLILQNVLYSNLKNICSFFWLPDWQPSDSSLLTGRLWYKIVAHKTDFTYRTYFKSSNEWNMLPFCPPETIRKCEIDVLATGQPH